MQIDNKEILVWEDVKRRRDVLINSLDIYVCTTITT